MRRVALLAVMLGGCEAPRNAGFVERAAATTGTFVGASAILLAMPVLIPTAILYSVVTRTPLIGTAPPPTTSPENVEAPRSAR